MPVKLLIFDLDGTLIDTGRDITNALNYALSSQGFKSLSVEDTIKMIGEGITRLIEKILGHERSQERDAVIKKFLDYYSEHLIDYSTVYPYVRETLEQLDGYKKAVISNKREYLSVKILNKLNLLDFFNMVVGSDTTSEKKPSAIPILHVIEKFKVGPQETIIVGDSNYDIEAGRTAGIKTIAVTYGYREKEYLMNADYIIDRFNDLPAILDIISSKLI
ncbi:MAG: HAD-IA family hydrolase [Thermodesulfovibrionales bacterium]